MSAKEVNKNMEQVISELRDENLQLRRKLEQAECIGLRDNFLEYSDDCIALFRGRQCLKANSAFKKRIGSMQMMLEEVSLTDLFSEVADEQLIQDILAAGDDTAFEARISGSEGAFFAQIRIHFLNDTVDKTFFLTITDIDKWKKKELQLSFEHNELEAIFDTSLIGLLYLDDSRIVRRINQRGVEIFRLQNDGLIVGKSLRSFHIDDKSYEDFSKFYGDILRDGKVLAVEYPMKTSDGGIFWLHLSGRSVYDAGKFLGTIWIFDDISQRRQVQHELQRTTQELNAYFENSLIGMLIFDVDVDGQRIVSRVNKKFAELAGLTYKEKVIGESTDVFACSRLNFIELFNQIVSDLEKADRTYFERELVRKNGGKIWVTGFAQCLDSVEQEDRTRKIIVMLDDTTEKKADRLKLEEANAELETYFNNSMVGIVVSGEDRIIRRANKRICDILGYSKVADLVGKSLSDVNFKINVAGEELESFKNILKTHKVFKRELSIRKKNNRDIWICVSGKAVDSNTPADLGKGIVWVVEDITARKIAEAKLVNLACIDELTGVNNRRNFMNLCERAVSVARRKKQEVALFMIDLDYFKIINDTYGHAVGDETLRLFAQICKQSLRPSDILGRIGGEEFAVFLPETSKHDALMVAQRLRRKVNEYFEETSADVPAMTISIGVSCFSRGEELSEVLKRADKALYKAKDAGRNRVIVD